MKVITLPLGPLATNCYLAADEETGRCAVIDPAGGAAVIAETMQKYGWTPDCVLLTHGHFDHVGATRALREAFHLPIYIAEADTDDQLAMSHGRLVYTDTYGDGDEVKVGSLTFRVLATPGHSAGSVCLLCGNTLFSGDTLFCGSMGRTDFAGSSPEAMVESLRRLGSLPGDYCVLPGHGEETTLEEERRFNPYLKEAMRP